ncbi:uncharacterized protein L201_001134 [Kwoniella dendrophila CBS 6074]|uniref:Zn(2)-C6 fungal-type domain-containing protein n=1 Tax=Kwoniella dendrophila CBS 6074 TaxID=1295534 RepID=A0AAX4JLI1_9TREE
MSISPPRLLNPIPTLSDALQNEDNSSMVIAPELMGEEGLPPSIKRRASDHEDDENNATTLGLSSNGYQSSSARDERSDWGNNNHITNDRHHHQHQQHQHPWEEGYGDQQQQQQQQQQDNLSSAEYQPPGQLTGIANDSIKDNQEIDQENGNNNDGNSDKPKPRKRARVSKPRQSKDNRNGNLREDGLPEEGILDFADPSGDFKLGPVYVHPPKGAAQACVRCHKIKRKCDNAKPRCAGCNKADVACVFELSPATASYVTSLKSDNIALTSQIASAAERIQHLESAISNLERGLPPPPERDPYEESDHHFSNQLATQADFAAMSKTILSVKSDDFENTLFGNHNGSNEDSTRNAFLQQFSTNPNTLNQQHRQQSSPLPPYDVALQAVETFFATNAISYPLLDREEFFRDMDAIYHQEQSGERRSGSYDPSSHQNDEDARIWASKEFILFMTIAIGSTSKERLGEVEKGSTKHHKVRALAILPSAVAKEDIFCVQSLTLLAIYAIFDPSGISIWHVIGFAARVALALNLHRRVQDSSVPANVVENRRRVFYSLFNLDRLVAVTLSKPLAITDNDIDVELPTQSPTDEAFRGQDRMEYTRHIIKLRRLGGIIHSTVYSVSGELSKTEKWGILHDLRSKLDQWLSECPVANESENDNSNNQDVKSTSMLQNQTHSWFSLNYQQLICLLYKPSPLNPNISNEDLTKIYVESSNCLDTYLNLWKEQKIVYNLINVSMQYQNCIILLYSIYELDKRNNELKSNPQWNNQVNLKLNQSKLLLDKFSNSLGEHSKLSSIYKEIFNTLLPKYGPLIANEQELELLNSGSKSLTENEKDREFLIPLANNWNSSLIDISLKGLDDENNNNNQNENDPIFKLITQLWFDSGNFNFNQQNLPFSTSSSSISPLVDPSLITQVQNQQDDFQLNQIQNQDQNDLKSRDLGSARGLWHQLG